MSIVIMVVCKILRTAEKSKIFTPHNPYMMGLYSMLAEYKNHYINLDKDVDKNSQREIQLVLKNRSNHSETPQESTLFRDFDNLNSTNPELMFLQNKIQEFPLIIIADLIDEKIEGSDPEEIEDVGSDREEEMQQESEIEESVNIIGAIKAFPDLNEGFIQNIANQGITKAMRDIREPVIRRVIPITLITTRILVLKDFALESEAEKLKVASI